MQKVLHSAAVEIGGIADRTGAPANTVALALLTMNGLQGRARRRAWVRLNGWSLFPDGSMSRWTPATGELVLA